eukprot:TRINITY_DN1680_c0_g1_i3.p1 TRINITY_DN1680_c0_g1~~TRINITY_DN1680_c0_g1_i3.p1  ORF type:complete len:189 (+),score=35.48 TRINITY_DN1680_c0_g1_i3:131-697(+)
MDSYVCQDIAWRSRILKELFPRKSYISLSDGFKAFSKEKRVVEDKGATVRSLPTTEFPDKNEKPRDDQQPLLKIQGEPCLDYSPEKNQNPHQHKGEGQVNKLRNSIKLDKQISETIENQNSPTKRGLKHRRVYTNSVQNPPQNPEVTESKNFLKKNAYRKVSRPLQLRYKGVKAVSYTHLTLPTTPYV